MQILQWLFKNANETNCNNTCSKKEVVNDQQEVKSQDIVLFKISQKKRNRAGKSSCKIFKLFNRSRSRRDIAADYFYSTIHLKRLGSSRRRRLRFFHSMKMKKQSLSRGLSFRGKTDSATAKVLPVSNDAVGTTASKNGHKDQSISADNNKKEKTKGDKVKTVSKMKELMRWAAAAKSQKGGKYFGRKILQLRDRSVSKAVGDDDDQLSYDSPKISFRWDVESCTTTSSYSVTKNEQYSINNSPLNSNLVHKDEFPAPTRKGNWVTTDSEFVVLEL